jgi:hypothetical protein
VKEHSELKDQVGLINPTVTRHTACHPKARIVAAHRSRLDLAPGRDNAS